MVRVAGRGLGAALLLILLGAVALVAGSDYHQVPTVFIDRPGDPPAPRWTKSCQRRDPDTGDAYVLSCARVRGRVVYVEGDDPDGDGDAHALVVAGPRLVIVKYPGAVDGAPPGSTMVPGLGDRVEAAGAVSRGGLTSIDTFSRRSSPPARGPNR